MRLVPVGARLAGLRITLAFMSVALLASGCRVVGAGAAGAATNQTITVAVVPGVGNAPLYVAARDGLFTQHGVHVVIKQYAALGSVAQALSSGKAQVASGDYTSFLYEESLNQLSLRLVADGYDATQNMTEILTLPGSAITGPADLEGKTVATPLEPGPQVITNSTSLPYDIETLAAQSVLQSDGVSPSSVNWKPTPVQDMISELRTGAVNAILVTEPYVFKAKSQLGAQEVVDAGSGVAAGLPLTGYFSLRSYARANSAALGAFRAALLQAQGDAAVRGPVQAVLPGSTGMTSQDAVLVTLGTYPTFLSIGQVQRVAQLMFEAGMTNNLLNVRSMVSG
jgi:NitT/TauT family transport system substrate-binding protein